MEYQTDNLLYKYDAWGNILSQNGPMADLNPYRYASYRFDNESELYYLIARYYDPKEGLFLSIDPDPGENEQPASQHFYMYVQNNPVMLNDPDGEHPVIVIVVSIGGRYVIKKVAKTAVKKVSKSTLKKAKGKLYVNRNAYKVNNKVAKNKGKPLKGYKGGTYENRRNQLPTNARYTEHDIYPLSKSWGKGKKRGKQRIVRGSDGKVYYTKNHYKTFIRIK